MRSHTNRRVVEVCKSITTLVEEEILPTCDVFLVQSEGEGYRIVSIYFSEKEGSTEPFDLEKYEGRNLDISPTLKNATIKRETNTEDTWYQLDLKFRIRGREDLISTYLAGYFRVNCPTLY